MTIDHSALAHVWAAAYNTIAPSPHQGPQEVETVTRLARAVADTAVEHFVKLVIDLEARNDPHD